MGIILKKSKLIFDELIGTNSFDEIFKNSIRDYYTYGFKSYEQFSKGNQILSDRWKVFSKVLGTKWYFEKREDGRNQITLKTMPCRSDNPIDDMYFLHNLSKIGEYLNHLLDLSPHAYVRGGVEALPVKEEELMMVEGCNGVQSLLEVDEVEYAIIQNWKGELERQGRKPLDAMPVRINRQLNIWSANTRSRTSSYKDKYSKLSNRTEYLYSLGILGDLRNQPDLRNRWLQKQWARYNPLFKRYFNHNTSGNHFWYKSPVTMRKLYESFWTKENEEAGKQFLQQFQAMCAFFSQYYPLGEVGTLLVERCSYMQNKGFEKVFQFKHNYLQKTLYDYNLIDILIAIENRYLCLIQYSHGTNLHVYEDVILPLEIRISVTNGREYVLYYHMQEKKIRALRLEFIDNIVIYSHVSSIKRRKCIVRKTGSKISREEVEVEDIAFQPKELAQQVLLAEQMLPFIWGTGITGCEVKESWKGQLVTYTIPITYDPQKEKYIENRLKKENRLGTGEKSICVFPTKEIRNWIRSFYVRISDSFAISNEDFNIEEDVEAMWNVYFKNRDLPGGDIKEYKKSNDSEYIESNYIVKGTVIPETEGHVALFNEMFSRYAIVMANSVLACSTNLGESLKKSLLENINNTFDYYSDKEKQKVVLELMNFIENEELINSSGESRFVVPKCDYLFDLLPLTKVEVRWLFTVLEDPLATVFLSLEQIEKIKEILQCAPFAIKKFQLNAINYYDRYNVENRTLQGKKTISQAGRITENELTFLKRIYQAIQTQKMVEITYSNWEGEQRVMTCAPTWIEYSRRDDVFRLLYVYNEKKMIYKVNLPRILDVTVLTERSYSLGEQRALLEEVLESTMTSIKVEFYQGNRNLPDRLLTEFSLWKKKCVYDVKTQKYIMTLYYSTLDEKEIMVRLLSYGPYIKISASEDNYVLNELKNRIAKQRDLIREIEFELE